MSSKKKVFTLLILVLELFFCKSSDIKNYTNFEMIYEDPLVYESWTFTRELYNNSSYIDNDKEICYFLSSNWKYENHNVFIEYIFATKNFKNLKINLYKVIINHDETVSKSYNHDIEGAWNVILFEKMEPQTQLFIDSLKITQFNKMIDKWINKGKKYKMMKINNISFFEKINQIKQSNAYICSVSLKIIDENQIIDDNNKIIIEDFLIEEEISSGDISMRYVIFRNPNL